ncbi:MAG: di-heme oxidoredictase family protein [Acidobacteriota bacterium]
MTHRNSKLYFLILLLLLGCVVLASRGDAQKTDAIWKPEIPKTWVDGEIAALEIPLSDPASSPKHISADYYYRIPVRPIYRSYPIYAPGKEPPGYLERLSKLEPQITFDASKLRTEQEWIRAGEIVFDAPIQFVSSGMLVSAVRDLAWYQKNRVPITRSGIFPNMQYVVREKGKVEVGILSCAMCHTRVMPDGSTIKGAQGNFPDDRTFGYESRLEAEQAKDKDEALKGLRDFMRRSYAAPWLGNDPNALPERMTVDEIASVMEAIPPGVCARLGSSAFFPARIPDLIGVKDRRHLDASGLVRHLTIGDLMRYAALNQGVDVLSLYGSFRPKGELPDPATESRYSDEQLYALALYVYSLKPPPNPNRFDARAARGQKVFQREGCAGCHTPPLYTNNKLMPADGFKAPAEHRQKYDILSMSVGTDPNLTMKTRRGTGYYKVPSLKGVWYRGPFEHSGSVATLEDWFDRRRLRDDYVPTGFKGSGVTTRAVKGHEFGLDLSDADRKALIAFLRTL